MYLSVRIWGIYRKFPRFHQNPHQTMLGLSLVQAQRCRHPAASKNLKLASKHLKLVPGRHPALKTSNLEGGWWKTRNKTPPNTGLKHLEVQKKSLDRHQASPRVSKFLHVLARHPPWSHHSARASPRQYWCFPWSKHRGAGTQPPLKTSNSAGCFFMTRTCKPRKLSKNLNHHDISP